MGKLLNRLQLQTFLILWIIYTASGAPFSKYGRTCKDIGCLPRETCVMAYDTCSFNQQEGSNCGRYPTCQKRMDAQPPQQNSGPILLNPAPENTRASTSDHSPPRDAINPNNVFGYPSSNNIYPPKSNQQLPLDIPRLPDNRQPFPASPNQVNGNIYQYPYHPDLTPPPNIFHFPTPPPNNYYNIYRPTQPNRSSSTMINNASLNLMLLGLLFLLIYRISNNSA